MKRFFYALFGCLLGICSSTSFASAGILYEKGKTDLELESYAGFPTLYIDCSHSYHRSVHNDLIEVVAEDSYKLLMKNKKDDDLREKFIRITLYNLPDDLEEINKFINDCYPLLRPDGYFVLFEKGKINLSTVPWDQLSQGMLRVFERKPQQLNPYLYEWVGVPFHPDHLKALQRDLPKKFEDFWFVILKNNAESKWRIKEKSNEWFEWLIKNGKPIKLALLATHSEDSENFFLLDWVLVHKDSNVFNLDGSPFLLIDINKLESWKVSSKKFSRRVETIVFDSGTSQFTQGWTEEHVRSIYELLAPNGFFIVEFSSPDYENIKTWFKDLGCIVLEKEGPYLSEINPEGRGVSTTYAVITKPFQGN